MAALNDADLALLADTGTTVAHCPVVFARYGHRLESFGAYRRLGINIGLGTDTAPITLTASNVLLFIFPEHRSPSRVEH